MTPGSAYLLLLPCLGLVCLFWGRYIRRNPLSLRALIATVAAVAVVVAGLMLVSKGIDKCDLASVNADSCQSD